MYIQIPEAVAQNKIELKKGHHHTNILIHIAKLFNYESYLEIGINLPQECFDLIPCDYKISVDPNSKADYQITSNEFWKKIDKEIEIERCPEKYDLIFIDGEHTYKESKNDLTQSLKYLSPKGTIVLHDVKPWNEDSQKIPRISQQWNGDVWKTAVDHIATANHLGYTIDCDYGVCCIHPFAEREQKSKSMTSEYKIFKKYQDIYLNLISIEQWYKKIKDISLQAQADSSEGSSWKYWLKKVVK